MGQKVIHPDGHIATARCGRNLATITTVIQPENATIDALNKIMDTAKDTFLARADNFSCFFDGNSESIMICAEIAGVHTQQYVDRMARAFKKVMRETGLITRPIMCNVLVPTHRVHQIRC